MMVLPLVVLGLVAAVLSSALAHRAIEMKDSTRARLLAQLTVVLAMWGVAFVLVATIYIVKACIHN